MAPSPAINQRLRQARHRKKTPVPSSVDLSVVLPSSPPSPAGEWCEIKEIIGEKPTRYRVSWAGTDPDTGLPWKPEWVKKDQVTEDAKLEWEEKRLEKRSKRKIRRRRKNKLPSPSSATPHEAPPSRINKRLAHNNRGPPSSGLPESFEPSQISEYQPTQVFTQPDFSSPFARVRPRRRRHASSNLQEVPDSEEAEGPHSRQSSGSLVAAGVLVAKPTRFDASAYAAVKEVVQIIATQHDPKESDNEGPILQKPALSAVSRRQSILAGRVIPDSQGLDESPFRTLSTYVQETSLIRAPEHRQHEEPGQAVELHSQGDQTPAESDIFPQPGPPSTGPHSDVFVESFRSPPPSYEESIAQSTQNSAALQASQSTKSADSQVINVDYIIDVSSHSLSDRAEEVAIGEVLPSPRPAELSEEEEQESQVHTIQTRVLSAEPELVQGCPEKELQYEGRESPVRPFSVPPSPKGSIKDWFTSTQPVLTARPQSAPPATQQAEHTDNSTFPQPPDNLSLCGGSFPRPPEVSSIMSEGSPSGANASVAALESRQAERERAFRERMAARRRLSSLVSTPERPFVTQPRADTTSSSNVQSTPAEEPRGSAAILGSSPMPPPSAPSALSPTPAPPVENVASSIGSSTASSDSLPARQVVGVDDSLPLPVSQSPGLSQDLFGPPNLGPEEYAIGLPLNTRSLGGGQKMDQRWLHLNEIVTHHQQIMVYLANSPEVEESEIFKLTQKIANIVTHPELAYPRELTPGVPESKLADMDAILSSKFQFLKEFMEHTKHMRVKIGIVAHAPATIDILELFFRGLKIQHKRLDKISILPPISDDDIDSMITVFLVPSTSDTGAIGNNCNLVFAMDSTFDADSFEVRQIRKDLYQPGKLAPVVRLVTVNTVEHILLCLKDFSNLRATVDAVAVLKNDAGIIDHTYEHDLGDGPLKTSRWVDQKFLGPLNIPPIPDLPLYETMAQSQTQSRIQAPSQTQVQVRENGEKRKRQDTMSSSQIQDAGIEVKKVKVSVEPQAMEIVEDSAQDTTHITDTMRSPLRKSTDLSQLPEPKPETANESDPTQRVEDVPMDLDSCPESDSGVHTPIARLIHRPKSPELEELPRESLAAMIRTLTADLESHTASASRLQFRYEDLRTQYRAALAEQKFATEASAAAIVRQDRALTELQRTRERHSALQSTVDEERRSHSLSGDPLDQLLENQRSEIAELQRKLAAAARDKEEAEFVRVQYQNASSAVQLKSAQVQELEAENEVLRRKADERPVLLKKMWYESMVGEKNKRIAQLESMLREREARLTKLEVEKKEGPRRGPWGMRSGSVPKSRATSPKVSGLGKAALGNGKD